MHYTEVRSTGREVRKFLEGKYLHIMCSVEFQDLRIGCVSNYKIFLAYITDFIHYPCPPQLFVFKVCGNFQFES